MRGAVRRVTGVYATRGGALIEDPALDAYGWDGRIAVRLTAADVIPMPPGASVCSLPGRAPLQARSASARQPTATAVAALLPQGYTRLLYPAYRLRSPGVARWAGGRQARVPRAEAPDGGAPRSGVLPLFGYTAMGFLDGRPVVAAMQTDDPHKWDPRNYDLPSLRADIDDALALFPNNRVIRGLARCATHYSCFTAQNIFYVRWEGGIPVSPACNARCLACISSQPAGGCPSPQERIAEPPSAGEIAEVAARHLAGAPGAVISFGQGCEGEPSLEAERIAQAIARIRKQTGRGTINMNTNAGDTAAVQSVLEAGLDSLRVTVVSGVAATYERYHRPAGYGLEDVVASVRAAVSTGARVALNLLVAPGLTDREEEVEGLLDLIERSGPHSLQLRNLNVDPELLFSVMGRPEPGRCIGVSRLVRRLVERFPGLELGSYTKPAPARQPEDTRVSNSKEE